MAFPRHWKSWRLGTTTFYHPPQSCRRQCNYARSRPWLIDSCACHHRAWHSRPGIGLLRYHLCVRDRRLGKRCFNSFLLCCIRTPYMVHTSRIEGRQVDGNPGSDWWTPAPRSHRPSARGHQTVHFQYGRLLRGGKRVGGLYAMQAKGGRDQPEMPRSKSTLARSPFQGQVGSTVRGKMGNCLIGSPRSTWGAFAFPFADVGCMQAPSSCILIFLLNLRTSQEADMLALALSRRCALHHGIELHSQARIAAYGEQHLLTAPWTNQAIGSPKVWGQDRGGSGDPAWGKAPGGLGLAGFFLLRSCARLKS